MKVVLFPDIVGYHSISMQRYATELSKALHDVADNSWQIQDYVCYPSNRAVRLLPGQKGVQLASRLGRNLKYPWMAAQVPGDVFHVLDHSHANLTLGLNPHKTVITCHDIIPLLAAKQEIAMTTSKLTEYTFPLRIRCMSRCARIIAISESTKRDLIRLAQVPEERIQVVYYGVNESFAPAPKAAAASTAANGSAVYTEETVALRAKHGIPADAKVILHVGTKERYKNSPALIKALRELNAGPELQGKVWLLRVGAEFYEDEEELIKTLGLQERVVHAGRVYDDAKLATYYRAADVFAFPSLYEGFGWPPLEAMACGTPVVTSNVASLPEVVGDAGLMVEPADYQALAQQIHAVLTKPEFKQALVEKCLARAAKFTWQQTARNTLAVYEEVAADNR